MKKRFLCLSLILAMMLPMFSAAVSASDQDLTVDMPQVEDSTVEERAIEDSAEESAVETPAAETPAAETLAPETLVPETPSPEPVEAAPTPKPEPELETAVPSAEESAAPEETPAVETPAETSAENSAPGQEEASAEEGEPVALSDEGEPVALADSIEDESDLLYAGNTMASATAISCGKNYSGRITSANTKDFYKITLGSSGRLSISFDGSMEYIDCYVYDADGYTVWSTTWHHWNSVSERNVFDYLLDVTSGTYYIAIVQQYNTTGSYNLRLGFTSCGETFKEPQWGNNNKMASATKISTGKTYKGQIALDDAKDFYRFTLASSGRLKINFDGNMRYIDCYVYDADGYTVWSETYHGWNSTSARNTISEVLDVTSGTYYIAIVQRRDTTGSYNLHLGFTSCGETFKEPQWGNNNKMASATKISTGKTYKGQIAMNDTTDFYKFTLSKARTVTLSFSGNMEYMNIFLYNSKGTELWWTRNGWDSTSQKNKCTRSWDLSKGTYYIAFERYYGRTGNYSFKVSAAVKNGWYLENGEYYYYKNGSKCTGWIKPGGSWYYLQSDGSMVTGWRTIGGKQYYFNYVGAMVTDWQYIGRYWYYFGSDGAMRTGWLEQNSTWYYLRRSDGRMLTGWNTVDGTRYYFDSNGGAMAGGWTLISGDWYYFNSNGSRYSGWLSYGGCWYYMDSNAYMVKNVTRRINGTYYRFSSNGVCQNPYG